MQLRTRAALLALVLAPACDSGRAGPEPRATKVAAASEAKAQADGDAKGPGAEPSAGEPGKTPAEIAAEVRAAMDPSADPCVDFYQYACGGWIASTALPADQARWTRSFSVLREDNRALLRDVLSQAMAEPSSDEQRKLGQAFQACMNEGAIERAGAEPLAPLLAAVAEVKDVSSFMHVTGRLHRGGVRPLFGLHVGPDDKNPGVNIVHLAQGGLGLPDREYYLDAKRGEIRAAYERHVARMLELLGDAAAAAAAAAKDILRFETGLAKLQMTRAERRDPDLTYNKLDISGLKGQIPGLAWDAYLTGAGHPEFADINVDSPAYLEGAAKLLAASSPETLQRYLRWRVLERAAPHLSAAFVDENYAFYGKTLRGQQQIEDRWKRCVSHVGDIMGHALGSSYVERAFAGDSKQIALDLITRVEAAFAANLPSLTWMDDTTRGRAIEKMNAIRNKIGYPDKPRGYEGLSIKLDAHLANMLAGREFEFEFRAAQVGEPVDKDEWRRPPQVVNASYSGTRNEMWFPAGILQAPFFDQRYPMAMNFGGIGMVMGHELTHGFDDKGRKFDGTGTLRQWWDDQAVTAFEQRASCVSELYASQEVEPGLHINGQLTLGENIADLGGLKETFLAYQTWAKEHGDQAPHVEGLTNEQLLFVAFAQVWCTNQTPESLRVQVTTDPHSPARYRVNVPTMSSREFAEVFACEPGQPMAPKERCEVW